MAQVMESRLTVDTRGFDLGGNGKYKDDQTLAQDAGRVAVLAFLTVMSRKQDGKLIPLTDINPATTSAFLTCGANGGNLAAWQAIGDGEFAISVDGTLRNITGIVATAVVALGDLQGILQTACAGICGVEYDVLADVFTFYSLKTGLPASVITVLTAVVAGAGTDISGAGFLNGLTAVGTVTVATGEASQSIPAGLMVSDDVTAASLVAGDVTNTLLLVGSDKQIDEDLIILENSLTLASIIVATGKSIREHLQDMGIYPTKSQNDKQIAPI